MARSTPTDRTALYRHYNAAGDLLYIGISLNAVARLDQHRHTSSWFGDIVRIDIEWHAHRIAALNAEREAIQAERPIHNLAHSTTMPPALVEMLRKIGGLHKVDSEGRILPKYMSLSLDEVNAMADKLG